MTKTVVSMSIDTDIAEQFNRIFPGQRSNFCNEQMRMRIRAAQGDLSGMKLEILLVEEKEIKEKADIINNRLSSITQQICLIKEMASIENKKKIEQEKDKIERMNKCEGCGKLIGESQEKKKIDNHIFCRSCLIEEHPNLKKAIRGDLM